MRHESLELNLRSVASLVQIFVAILCPPLRVWLATVGSLKSSSRDSLWGAYLYHRLHL